MQISQRISKNHFQCNFPMFKNFLKESWSAPLCSVLSVLASNSIEYSHMHNVINALSLDVSQNRERRCVTFFRIYNFPSRAQISFKTSQIVNCKQTKVFSQRKSFIILPDGKYPQRKKWRKKTF